MVLQKTQIFAGVEEKIDTRLRKKINELITALRAHPSKEIPSFHENIALELARIGAPAVPALIIALKDKGLNARLGAAFALNLINEQIAVHALIGTLKDEDPEIRWTSAVALGNIRNVLAIPELIRILNDKNDNVAYAAADALSKIGKPAVPALIEALKYPNDYTRDGAIYALSNIRDGRAVPSLIKILKDPNEKLRINAVKALGMIKDRRALPALRQLKKSDPFKEIKRAAEESIYRIQESSMILVPKKSRQRSYTNPQPSQGEIS